MNLKLILLGFAFLSLAVLLWARLEDDVFAFMEKVDLPSENTVQLKWGCNLKEYEDVRIRIIGIATNGSLKADGPVIFEPNGEEKIHVNIMGWPPDIYGELLLVEGVVTMVTREITQAEIDDVNARGATHNLRLGMSVELFLTDVSLPNRPKIQLRQIDRNSKNESIF